MFHDLVVPDSNLQLNKVAMPFASRFSDLIQDSRKVTTIEEALEDVFAEEATSCLCISIRVVHEYASVRSTIVRDLMNIGVNHGYVRRISPQELDVFIVATNPVLPDQVRRVAKYFVVKWAVKKEHFIVDKSNYTNLDFCRKGFFIYRSAFPDENSADENLDMMSVDGYQVLSEVSNPTKLVFGTK